MIAATTATGPAMLDRLLRRAAGYSAEFPPFMANHLPMVLVILDRLGAPAERLETFFERYAAASGLVPAPADGGRIDPGNWTLHLGDRGLEGDYRGFFAREVGRLGVAETERRYLPALVPGIAASALHALMRLAYGHLRADRAEIATALGYWAATWLPLGAAGRAAAITAEPAELLDALRGIEALHRLEPESDLLWHWMRAAAARPEFPPVADLLAPSDDLLARMSGASLALMAGTMSFEALHAVTSVHWLRLVGAAWPDLALAARFVWQAIAAVYPKMGFPEPASAERLDALRRLQAPPWPEIARHACASDDEHDISFTFSAMEEERAYGDRLFRVLAAKRLGLVA
jgi:hypothetical protein